MGGVTSCFTSHKCVSALVGIPICRSKHSPAHPLLSDEELAAFLDLQRKSVRCSLYELHQLRCLESIATLNGKRWHLCERALSLVAAATHVHIRNVATMSDDRAKSETSTVVQRGEAWLLQRIHHTAEIYSFFAQLAQAGRQEPEHVLSWWETGPETTLQAG
jgi:hypothetical protein